MKIDLTAVGLTPPPNGALEPTALQSSFGKIFTPHMFRMEFDRASGWHSPRIVPYEPLSLDPAALVLHYAQESFEGMKAYRAPDGEVVLFRPRDNARRMNHSNRRLCIPEIPESDFMAAVESLVDIDRDWVPEGSGCSLYIRPVVIATQPMLGVRISDEYLFYVVCSPAGPYFGSFEPVRILVSEDYTRAASGGTGAAKTAGNYAASLRPTREAQKRGYQQVLFLDAKERRWIEELGGMNFFAVIDDTLVTTPLTGTILPGITRRSLLQLADEQDLPVEERPLAIDELIEGLRAGRVSEVFACGTAAVVTPIGVLGYRGQDIEVNGNRSGEVAMRLYRLLVDIQTGRAPDPFAWRHPVPHRVPAPVFPEL